MNKLFAIVFVGICSVFAQQAGESVIYKVDGKDYEGYYVSPGKNAPLVMIIHDWDGLTGYEVKRAGMLLKQGYAAFAVDMFGKGVRPTKIDDKKKLTGALYADREKMRLLMEGGLDAAKSKGANVKNAVAIGYCFGGSCILEWARAGVELKALISFHGALSSPQGQDFANVKGQVLVFHGTADRSVPMSDFAQLADDLENADVRHEMTTYSSAPHAFTVFGSDRYREGADKKSWRRFMVFLENELK
ncbi:MAG: prolyl oligopeptidase family serine peptidase [Chitinivibrionales bacterium]|nr:prolyl oligopeptidase family serine peptidase [Chitinivibrionales bacterium]